MDIIITKLSDEEKKTKDFENWDIWEKEVSEFDWYYDSEEHCQIIEGEVEVIAGNKVFKFRAGDYVIFPKGLSCIWKINKAVRKYYKFIE